MMNRRPASDDVTRTILAVGIIVCVIFLGVVAGLWAARMDREDHDDYYHIIIKKPDATVLRDFRDAGEIAVRKNKEAMDALVREYKADVQRIESSFAGQTETE